MLAQDDILLFQGDSITDCDRNRLRQDEANGAVSLGEGYVRYAAGMLLADCPGVTIYNRGIGGDKIWQLEQRWQEDCLDLRPTWLSVLIGVNDTYHALTGGEGTSLQRYEAIYGQLLARTSQACPGIRFVLCEPFILPCGQVTDAWQPEMDARREIVRRVAADCGALFVPFQAHFDAALQRAAPPFWAEDGVHPTLPGHMLMARAWIQAVIGSG